VPAKTGAVNKQRNFGKFKRKNKQHAQVFQTNFKFVASTIAGIQSLRMVATFVLQKQSLNSFSTQYVPIKIYTDCYIISKFQSGMVNAVLLSRGLTHGFSAFGQTQLQTTSLPLLNNLSLCLSKRTCRKKYKDDGKSAALQLCS
jgi:hypothetical protein